MRGFPDNAYRRAVADSDEQHPECTEVRVPTLQPGLVRVVTGGMQGRPLHYTIDGAQELIEALQEAVIAARAVADRQDA